MGNKLQWGYCWNLLNISYIIQLHMLLSKPFFNSHGGWCVKIPWIRPGNLSSQIPGATPGAMKSWIWDVSSIATWWARQAPKRCIWAGFVENWGHFWRIMCSNWVVGMVITIFTSEVKWAIQYLVGGLEHVFFPFHIWDVILPIDELILFKMVQTTNQSYFVTYGGFHKCWIPPHGCFSNGNPSKLMI